MKRIKKEYILLFYVDVRQCANTKEVEQFMDKVKETFKHEDNLYTKIKSIKETYWIPIRNSDSRIEKLEFDVEYDDV